MRQIVMMTLIVALGALSSCKNDKGADAEDLLSSVPSSASMVGVADIRNLAEKAGCKIDGNSITASEELKKVIDGILNTDTREAVRMLLDGEAGLAPSSIVAFTDSYDSYIVGNVADMEKFRNYVESKTGEKFVKEGNVETCGSVAVSGSRAWMSVGSKTKVNAQAIANFSTLSRQSSFMSRDIADKLANTTDDLSVWADINALAGGASMSMSDKTYMRMILSALFDDAASLAFNLNFEKGEFTANGEVLNSKGEKAKYLLPAGKLDVKTVKSLGGNADIVTALNIESSLVKKIESMASSLGGALPAAYINLLKPLDGTLAFAISGYQGQQQGLRAVITTDGKPTVELNNMAAAFGQVKNDGKYIRIQDNGPATGGQSLEELAEILKGATAGVVLDGKVVSDYQKNGKPADISRMAMMLVPTGGGLELQLRIAAADSKENAFVTFLKMLGGAVPAGLPAEQPSAAPADSVAAANN